MAKAYTVTNRSATSFYTFKTGFERGERLQLRPGETREEVVLEDSAARALMELGTLEISGGVEVPPPRRRHGLRVKVVDAERNRVVVPGHRYMSMR